MPPPMLLAGAVLDQLPGPKYVASLRFAEIAFRAPVPRAATLRRQRAGLPADFTIALRAPRGAITSARGPLRIDEALEKELAWLIEARDALQARLVILDTPADLSPGGRSRELLAKYVERLPRDPERPYVWAPRGPWEHDEAEKVAHELGLVLAFDPLEQSCPAGDFAYGRLVAMGVRRSFSPASLEEALGALPNDGDTHAYVAIESERSFAQATQLQRLADDARSETDDTDEP